ncbi:hypothetical protein EXM22_07545 [Oceanispirochaeta crateris]|uniref:Uncharacterized protein n=1 Tax=Oceanispirochaeta crateris TaxID=2518645 RepID=A0A5C1QJT6_9SPIO|nr:hypothetical protein [Oceanispirochaeta crateris]QEN07851.1 hypothetical protein EXM22_07545 [Oceanispirochaeta crateris]
MSGTDFERSCKQLRKKYNFESTPEFRDDLNELFTKALGEGEDFSLELFEYCVPSEAVEDKNIEKLSDMIDLFLLDYNSEFNHLVEADWIFLKDLINVWALDMDMDTVSYIMQLVLDAGVFD